MANFRFGEWTVNPDRNLVQSNEISEHLEPKTMEVLVCLLDRAGQTVSLQDLLDAVWGDRVVEENSVHRRVYQIRKVLGDSSDNAKYIENVPKRGYRTVAAVTKLLDEAATTVYQEPSVSPPPVIEPLPEPANQLVRINRWVLLGSDRWIYLWLAILGSIPLLIAYLAGAWPDRVLPLELAQIDSCSISEHQRSTVGFSQRVNWLIYPILLPAWLFLSRSLFRMSYGFSATSPLRLEGKYSPIRNKLNHALNDWRPFAVVLAVNVLLTATDQWDVAMRFINVNVVCPTGVMDWGWYGLLFGDVTQTEIAALTIMTTIEQFLFVQIAINTAVHVFLFNSMYMRSIYLRSDASRQTGCYVLDFDDPDQRFGLRKISRIFDIQLLFCIFGGAVLLVERFMNTNLEVTSKIGTRLMCEMGLFENDCAQIGTMEVADLAWIFQDMAQIFVVFSWLFYLIAILWIANVKLMPLRMTSERAGRVSYLRELIPPGSKYDQQLIGDAAGVDVVANLFRKHDFWPTGDARAGDALAICLFIGFLLILPVWPSSPPLVLLWLLFFVAGLLLARTFLWIQKHLLTRVDRSLVR